FAKKNDPSGHEYAYALYVLAALYSSQERELESAREFEKAYFASLKVRGYDVPSPSDCAIRAGEAYTSIGRYDDGERLLIASLSIVDANSDPEDKACAWFDLGSLYFQKSNDGNIATANQQLVKSAGYYKQSLK